MNFNKNLWDETEAIEFGNGFEALELGGHEVVIMDAREYEGLTGNISLKISVDISGNDKQAGYFKKQYDEAIKKAKSDEEKKNVKWSNGAIRYLSLKDENLAYLKGFITSVENSNKSFKFNKDGNWDQLKGQKLAGVFGLEEYKDNEGNVKTATKLVQFRSLDKLSEIKIPNVKLLDGTTINYDEYKNSKTISNNENNFVEITAEEMPF